MRCSTPLPARRATRGGPPPGVRCMRRIVPWAALVRRTPNGAATTVRVAVAATTARAAGRLRRSPEVQRLTLQQPGCGAGRPLVGAEPPNLPPAGLAGCRDRDVESVPEPVPQ